MSVWSAIGLADRTAIEKLIEQNESLRKENRELFAENQRLILAQISERNSALYTAENQNTELLVGKILEMHKGLSAKMDGASRLIFQQIISNGESTRESLSTVKNQIIEDISAAQRVLNNLIQVQEETRNIMKTGYLSMSAKIKETGDQLGNAVSVENDSVRKSIAQVKMQMYDQLAAVIQNQEIAKDSVAYSFKELGEIASTQKDDIMELISRSLCQILDQQRQISTDSSSVIADSNKDLLLRIEQYCTSALEEVKKTGERYHQMEHNEQENLDKIKTLSNEMLELGEHQRNVMEQLSQLCQDSEQFMEIQKSINDIWEIMKAVWVDSLLNDYQKSLPPLM